MSAAEGPLSVVGWVERLELIWLHTVAAVPYGFADLPASNTALDSLEDTPPPLTRRNVTAARRRDAEAAAKRLELSLGAYRQTLPYVLVKCRPCPPEAPDAVPVAPGLWLISTPELLQLWERVDGLRVLWTVHHRKQPLDCNLPLSEHWEERGIGAVIDQDAVDAVGRWLIAEGVCDAAWQYTGGYHSKWQTVAAITALRKVGAVVLYRDVREVPIWEPYPEVADALNYLFTGLDIKERAVGNVSDRNPEHVRYMARVEAAAKRAAAEPTG